MDLRSSTEELYFMEPDKEKTEECEKPVPVSIFVLLSVDFIALVRYSIKNFICVKIFRFLSRNMN